MTTSVNTNVSAMVALANLNATNRSLENTQNRVSTGLRVANAKDDGAAFAVAQGLRGDVQGLEVVNQQLSVATGLTDVTLSAATSISDTLNTIRATITKLADENLSVSQRAQYSDDLRADLSEIQNFVASAVYNGTELLTAAAAPVNVIANPDGTLYTITNRDLETPITTFDGSVPAAGTAMTSLAAQNLLNNTDTAFNDLVTATDNALNGLAADNKRLKNQMTFNIAVRDATEAGLGAIVDADLARESANLQALQTKQQLAVQTLGIANQAPQALLGLFQ